MHIYARRQSMADNNFTGGLVISEDVIATIAINAAKDVEID